MVRGERPRLHHTPQQRPQHARVHTCGRQSLPRPQQGAGSRSGRDMEPDMARDSQRLPQVRVFGFACLRQAESLQRELCRILHRAQHRPGQIRGRLPDCSRHQFLRVHVLDGRLQEQQLDERPRNEGAQRLHQPRDLPQLRRSARREGGRILPHIYFLARQPGSQCRPRGDCGTAATASI